MVTNGTQSASSDYGDGDWPDLRIARHLLHGKLPRGEFYLADVGYQGCHDPSVTRTELPANEREMFDRLMARHETINRRFKEWDILSQKFRHAEHLHSVVFHAVVVLTQLDIEDGSLVWD